MKTSPTLAPNPLIPTDATPLPGWDALVPNPELFRSGWLLADGRTLLEFRSGNVMRFYPGGRPPMVVAEILLEEMSPGSPGA